VKSAMPAPFSRYDVRLADTGELTGIATQALLAGHHPSSLWQDAFGEQQYPLPVNRLAHVSLGPREEELPDGITGFPSSAFINYHTYSASPPAYLPVVGHRPGFLKDAEAWSSILHTHSTALPEGFTTIRQGLQEHVEMQDLKAMVKGVPLVIAFTGLVNARDQPADTASDPSPRALAALRRGLAQLARDYEQLDRERQLHQLEETANIQARLRAPQALLDELALVRGLSWHTMASMLAITPTAIRKWRRGGSLTPDNRQQLASLVAFFDLLDHVDNPPQNVGSWVEMPVREDTTLNPAEIYRNPTARWLLLEWVRGNLDTSTMLDRHTSDWRITHAPDPAFQVGIGPDGERAIIPR
jgi:hypothetical protein